MIPTPTPRDERARALYFNAADETTISDDGAADDASLEDAVRREQEYVRERLRGELGREPTDEELREWQREHTEGY